MLTKNKIVGGDTLFEPCCGLSSHVNFTSPPLHHVRELAADVVVRQDFFRRIVMALRKM